MPFAVHLYFDTVSEETIWTIWRNLAHSGVAPYMAASGARPHVTLAIYKTVAVSETEQHIQDWAKNHHPFHFAFSHLGVFCAPNPVVFAAPTVTTPLLDLHQAFHQAFGELGDEPLAYYLPGNWVPHCTMAFELDLAAVPEALAIAQELPLPLKGQITEIGLVEFRPVKDLFTFPLMGR